MEEMTSSKHYPVFPKEKVQEILDFVCSNVLESTIDLLIDVPADPMMYPRTELMKIFSDITNASNQIESVQTKLSKVEFDINSYMFEVELAYNNEMAFLVLESDLPGNTAAERKMSAERSMGNLPYELSKLRYLVTQISLGDKVLKNVRQNLSKKLANLNKVYKLSEAMNIAGRAWGTPSPSYTRVEAPQEPQESLQDLINKSLKGIDTESTEDTLEDPPKDLQSMFEQQGQVGESSVSNLTSSSVVKAGVNAFFTEDLDLDELL
jgi:hypothetical protein